MNSIKVFTEKSVRYTPFGGFHPMDLPFLEEHGIQITDDIQQADVIMSQNLKHLKKYFLRFFSRKKYLIWTLEPRFDTHFDSIVKPYLGLVKCHVMNIYTGDVFVSPLSFHAGLIDEELDPLPQDFTIPSRKIVGLMSYYQGLETPKLLKDGIDIDLIKVRSKIGLEGHKLGAMDVFGKGWPDGVSKEDSRAGNWVGRKKDILAPYFFNLCFENTVAYNYVTEKIWDSIADGCLPIYYGNNGIYQLFPRDSFIDYSRLKGPKALFDLVENMSDTEYIGRMNACIDVYNSISGQGDAFVKEKRTLALTAITQRLKKITSA